MKKLTLSLALVVFFPLNALSQKTILFKSHYHPLATYHEVERSASTNILTYSGSDEFLAALNDEGVSNPTVTSSNSYTETMLSTGAAASDGSVTFELEFIKSTKGDSAGEIPDGTLMFGTVPKDKLPIFDSIASEELSDEMKAAMLPMLENLINQFSFEPREMKEGHSFTIKSPLSFPIGGATLNMTIHTTYKLVSIVNDLGIFEIDQKYRVDTDIAELPIKAKGSGKGKIVYDGKEFYNKEFYLTCELEFDMKMKEFDIHMKTTNTSSTITDLKRN